MATISPLNLTSVRVQADSYGAVQKGRWMVFGTTLQPNTVLVNLNSWPPNPVLLEGEHLSSFDYLPDGRLVVCSSPLTSHEDYELHICPTDWPANLSAQRTRLGPIPMRGSLCEVHVISGRIFLFAHIFHSNMVKAAGPVYRLGEDGLEIVPELQIERTRTHSKFCQADQQHACGKITLGDGRELLVWNGDGYEWKNGEFEPCWRLRALGIGRKHVFSSVPWGDGFFYTSDARVMLSPSPGKLEHVLPDADRVISIGPGPDGSILVFQSSNPKRLAARIWFPDEGTYLPISYKDLGVSPRSEGVTAFTWSPMTRHFYVEYNGSLLTFPDSDLAAIKKVKPRKS